MGISRHVETLLIQGVGDANLQNGGTSRHTR